MPLSLVPYGDTFSSFIRSSSTTTFSDEPFSICLNISSNDALVSSLGAVTIAFIRPLIRAYLNDISACANKYDVLCISGINPINITSFLITTHSLSITIDLLNLSAGLATVAIVGK